MQRFVVCSGILLIKKCDKFLVFYTKIIQCLVGYEHLLFPLHI